MNIAVILAGGVGKRVGADRPKQFVEILGKPVLAYTIEAFQNHSEIDAIEVVCHKDWKDYLADTIDKYHYDKVRWISDGGETFQESVLKGIYYLDGLVSKDDIVLVHFGASPFIMADIITDCISVCAKRGNAISTTDYFLLSGEKSSKNSVTDADNYTDIYIDRDTIACMNSPHAFKYGYIKELYDEAIKTGVINEVEPHTTTLMYKMGRRIYFSKGSQMNIKITKQEDLMLFEGYVLQKKEYSKEMVSGDVIVFLADGFEECEGLLIVDLLRRAGLKTVTASISNHKTVCSSRAINIQADALAESIDFSSAKLIVLPGGRTGTENICKCDLVKEKCREFAKDKYVAAVCAAPIVLAKLGLMKKATVHPDFRDKMGAVETLDKAVVVDGNIITGQGLVATIPFALKLIEILAGPEKVEQIKEAIGYNLMTNAEKQ